jgi:hypothetical protein
MSLDDSRDKELQEFFESLETNEHSGSYKYFAVSDFKDRVKYFMNKYKDPYTGGTFDILTSLKSYLDQIAISENLKTKFNKVLNELSQVSLSKTNGGVGKRGNKKRKSRKSKRTKKSSRRTRRR